VPVDGAGADGARTDGAGAAGAQTVVFQVRDTGIGIAPEHHTRVFDPFWQAAPPLTRGVGGTGLGLSVVRALADALGGKIAFDSAPGRGSTFTLRLPATVPAALVAA
jgi:signal transduction histidine kinase